MAGDSLSDKVTRFFAVGIIAAVITFAIHEPVITFLCTWFVVDNYVQNNFEKDE